MLCHREKSNWENETTLAKGSVFSAKGPGFDWCYVSTSDFRNLQHLSPVFFNAFMVWCYHTCIKTIEDQHKYQSSIYPDTPCMPYIAYIDPQNHPNVGIFGIHGVSGIYQTTGLFYFADLSTNNSQVAPNRLRHRNPPKNRPIRQTPLSPLSRRHPVTCIETC